MMDLSAGGGATFGLKYDPGEPGFTSPFRAKDATIKVFNQELRNLNRFRLEALMKGEEVVFEDVSIQFSNAESHLVANHGQTRVTTRKETQAKAGLSLSRSADSEFSKGSLLDLLA